MPDFVKQIDGSYSECGTCNIAGMVVDDTLDFTIPVSGVPPTECESYYTESECTNAGCYWYDGACHGTPKEVPLEIPWHLIAIGGGIIVLIGTAVFLARK